MKKIDDYAKIIHLTRYARWNEKEQRRETWEETVDRYLNWMLDHLKKKFNYTPDNKTFKEVRDYMLQHDVYPSMRGLQYAGPALTANHVRLFNCVGQHMDSQRSFDESVFICMSGAGEGDRIMPSDAEKLPEVPEEFFESHSTVVVSDSVIGWASAFRELMTLLYSGKIPNLDTSRIRAKGKRLKTSGGFAPGPQPFIDIWHHMIDVFKGAAGRKLRTIELTSITTKIAEIVVTAGSRRCCFEDDLVWTDKGHKRLKYIEAGDRVKNQHGVREVIDSEYMGERECFRITTRWGTLTATEDHRFEVLNHDFSTQFKHVRDLRKDDVLIHVNNMSDINEYYTFTHDNTPLHFNADDCELPNVLDEKLAWVIGFHQGDGYTAKHNTLVVDQSDDNRVYLNYFNDMFSSVFGLPLARVEPRNNRAEARVRFHNSKAVRFMEKFKLPNVPLRVPDAIISSPNSVKAAYLAGILDSDGCISQTDNKEIFKTLFKCDFVSTKYPLFAEDISNLLSTLNIPNRISVTTKKGYDPTYTVYMKDEAYINNVCIIFDYSKKAELLGELPSATCAKGDTLNFEPAMIDSIVSVGKRRTYDISVKGEETFLINGHVSHNSAKIVLFSPNDLQMVNAKSGDWWTDNPHFSFANNSAVFNGRPSMKEFMEFWTNLMNSGSGEPGIINQRAAIEQAKKFDRDTKDGKILMNPCAEIYSFNSTFMCNLSGVNLRPEDSVDSIKLKLRAATILGVWQSTVTDFKYLRKVWKRNAEEEMLLGVWLSGVCDHPVLSEISEETGKILSEIRDYSRDVAWEEADAIGCGRTTSWTTIKPAGNSSQLAGVSSGIHAAFSKFYIRRIMQNMDDPLTKFLIDSGIPYEVSEFSPNSVVFAFPRKANNGAITADTVDAISQLERWRMYKNNYTTHTVSCTVYVKPDEWLKVGAYVYEHFDDMIGVSFLPYSDHTYKQAPYEAITEEEYNKLVNEMPKIDWSKFKENTDNIANRELECSGAACDIKF
jgi:intein/homing endonuclease